jgi:hypothetical protein
MTVTCFRLNTIPLYRTRLNQSTGIAFAVVIHFRMTCLSADREQNEGSKHRQAGKDAAGAMYSWKGCESGGKKEHFHTLNSPSLRVLLGYEREALCEIKRACR